MLVTLARESRQKGWWHTYGDSLEESFRTYVGLEADAIAVRSYESEYVPGLLQTEEYAREVIRTGSLTAATDEESRNMLQCEWPARKGWRAANCPNCGS